MADAICNNPTSLRICILYEFLKGEKPFETYKSMMKTLGDDFMEYPEFEFWHMRFAKGNFDLDYDISLEPKKRQITDLPVDVFEKVGDSLHFEDRDPLVKLLKNPKLRLKKLTVCQDEEWMKIEEELRESSTKLHVNNVTVQHPEYPISFYLFAPKSLEEVTVYTNESSFKKMNEILRSENCKQLKMLTIKTDLSPSNFPFGSFIGIPRFTIKFHEGRAERKVSQFIKKLINCTQLELCKLESVYYDDWFNWESIGKDLHQRGTLVPDSPNTRRYSIQGSTDFYEINMGKNSVSIERKS